VFDGLSLALVEARGFRVGHLTGSGGAASSFGLPDIGVVSMGEMVDHVRRLCGAAHIPLVADGDTGYGGPLQIRRTVESLIAAGAAGAHFEDQTSPKRCGFLPGRTLIGAEEFSEKLAAAATARVGGDLVIIARTDALALEGVAEAVTRARAYQSAGADVIFVEGITDRSELEQIGREVPGPKMLNMAGPIARCGVDDTLLVELGYRILIYPGLLIDAAAGAIGRTLDELTRLGRSFVPEPVLGPVGLSKLMGIENWIPGLFDELAEP
jgi:2-methylisocitrate lyase-like PEP mutase family enzyme